jgi:hypothetical protein
MDKVQILKDSEWDTPSSESHTTVTLHVSPSLIVVFLKLLSVEEEKVIQFIYSRTSNNGHCRGIQILSVIGGVR